MRMPWYAAVLVIGALTSCDSIKKAAIASRTKPAAAAPAAGAIVAVEVLTADSYATFLDQPGKLVVVDFYADWCGPCRKLAPMLYQMAGEFSDSAVVGKLNIDHAEAIAQKAGVEGIPDVRFFLNGKEVDRIVGVPPESELRAVFARHAREIDVPAAAAPVVPPPVPPAVAETPAPPPARAAEEASTGPAADKDVPPQEKEPAKPKEPAIQPMKKNWMPPGIEKR